MKQPDACIGLFAFDGQWDLAVKPLTNVKDGLKFNDKPVKSKCQEALMVRVFYISDDLDDLELVEYELELSGLGPSQIHVLTDNDAEVASHQHLHPVKSFMRNDVIHSTEIGAVIGVVVAALVLFFAYATGVVDTVGWLPFIMLAIIMMGFITWKGACLVSRSFITSSDVSNRYCNLVAMY